MIARHDVHTEKADIWSRLAEPLPNGVVSWRQDGKIIQRDGRYYARFVAYIDANTARERLDAVVPGEWDLTLELLPPLPVMDDNNEGTCSFKARLQILGVIREDVGTGRDYKSAATDAFKRAAVRFGIAHELYSYQPNWVEMDGDGRNAKPLEDPAVAYARRYGPTNGAALPDGETPNATVRTRNANRARASAAASAKESAVAPTDSAEPITEAQAIDPAVPAPVEMPSCPKCGGKMWDNRLSKRNPKAPDFKCRDRSCDGVIWPSRTPAAKGAGNPVTGAESPTNSDTLDASPLGMSANDIPF